MEHRLGTFTATDGTRLFAQSWLPEEGITPHGVIIIVHGLAEHSSRYAHVADYFVQQGYAVHAMDARGHGQSRGTDFGYFERFVTLVDDLAAFVDHVHRSRHGNRPTFLLGHSMGGLLALYYVIRHQPPPSVLCGLVTSAALLDAGQRESPLLITAIRLILSPLLPRMGLRPLDSSTLSRNPAVVQDYDTDPNVFRGKVMARVAGELLAACQYVRVHMSEVRLPILCMHGGGDRLVDPACARFIYEHVSSMSKTLKVYDGLYHEIMNEPERTRVLADIWVWLASQGKTSELRTGQTGA